MFAGELPPLRLVSRLPSQFVADIVVVAAVVVLVVGVSGSSQLGALLPQPATDQVLTVVAAVIAAGGAILGAIGAHLIDDARPRWVAAALALYALVVLPATALLPATGAGSNAEGLRLVGYGCAIAMLICAIHPPERISAAGTWVIAALGVAVSVGVFLGPPTSGEVIRSPIATVIMLAAWTVVAAAVTVDGYRRNTAARWRAGLGLVVMAGAQLARMLVGSAPPMFAALRLTGLVIVVTGFTQLIVRAVAEMNSRHSAHQEDLTRAALHMEKAAEAAAERDHELRNGLAGLAGIAHLLSTDPANEQHGRLKHAVLSELSRLHRLVDGRPAEADDDPTYEVEPVIDGLVALRRLAGADIRADVSPGLRAAGHSAVLAQVITNLLANCDRHAPGAAVVVHAYADADDAVVEVADFGPGLPPGPTEFLLDRGVRDEQAGGLGLGLHISRDLIHRQGGTLSLQDSTSGTGCVARVTVPRAYMPELTRRRH